MDQRKFEELLTEFCEWQHEAIVGPYSRPSRRKKVSEQQLNDDGIDLCLEHTDIVDIVEGTDDGRTKYACDIPHEQLTKLRPIKVKQIIQQPQPCQDCDRICKGQPRREHRLINPTEWRTRCTECHQYLNPYTGKFDLNIQAVYKVFGKYANQKQRLILAKG